MPYAFKDRDGDKWYLVTGKTDAHVLAGSQNGADSVTSLDHRTRNYVSRTYGPLTDFGSKRIKLTKSEELALRDLLGTGILDHDSKEVGLHVIWETLHAKHGPSATNYFAPAHLHDPRG